METLIEVTTLALPILRDPDLLSPDFRVEVVVGKHFCIHIRTPASLTLDPDGRPPSSDVHRKTPRQFFTEVSTVVQLAMLEATGLTRGMAPCPPSARDAFLSLQHRLDTNPNSFSLQEGSALLSEFPQISSIWSSYNWSIAEGVPIAVARADILCDLIADFLWGNRHLVNSLNDEQAG